MCILWFHHWASVFVDVVSTAEYIEQKYSSKNKISRVLLVISIIVYANSNIVKTVPHKIHKNALEFCKPTFIHVQEIFARFARTSSSWIFIAVNKSMLYGCYNDMSLDKAWSRKISGRAANQFIRCISQNKVVAKKSWFAVL